MYRRRGGVHPLYLHQGGVSMKKMKKMNKYQKRRLTAIIIIIIIIALLFGSIYAIKRFSPDSPENSPKKSLPVTSLDEKTAEEMNRSLTVSIDDYTYRYNRISMKFLKNSMPDMAHQRTKKSGFSDAVSFPFKSRSADEAYKELQEEILRNPVICDMVIRALKDLELASGSTVGDLNPWMQKFLSKMDDAMSKKDHPRGNEIWLERFEDDDGILVTKEYRRIAAMVVVLLGRFKNNGIVKKATKINYCLPLIAEGSITRTKLADYQEDKEAISLSFVRKDNKTELTIGFNIHDKRFELFGSAVIESRKTGGGGGIIPGIKPNPNPKPKPKPGSDPKKKQGKNPAKDPVNKGNAKRGGGDNRKGDGSGKYQPKKPGKTGSHQNPEKVKPKTPPPPPGRKPGKADHNPPNRKPQRKDTNWKKPDGSSSNGGKNNNSLGEPD